ncbi:hypothetical protein ACVR0H_09720 [Streptococcus constellatus subsp. viborgensis]|uniref:hypothetical protein n=1 Tax=Streptococcus constellatus TaxID=76860 RepID=UPI0018E165B6|nr:hypothetical protein [Streptococcus constellatus]QQC22863.1 hypothetical protein I6H72_09140 [Streptococcus constellatus]
MEKIYGKLAPKGQQPIRKHRVVFTSTKGLFRKQRWVMLDIDENGITYNSEPGHTGDMFSSMYLAIGAIIIDERAFTITIKNPVWDDCKIYVIDLKKLDGDLWTNFTKIKDTLIIFAGNKLVN